MIFKLSNEQPQKIKTDILVLPVLKDKKQIESAVSFLSKNLNDELLSIANRQNFNGRAGQHFMFYTQKPLCFWAVLLIGLGSAVQLSNNEIRESAGIAVNIALKYKAKKLAFSFPLEILETINPENLGQSIAEGVKLADYKFEDYKSKKNKKIEPIQEIAIISKEKRIKLGVKKGEIISSAVILSRNLVNQPSLYMTPKRLVITAENIAHNNKDIELKIYNQKKLQELGFGGILGVAQGSDQEPYLIHLVYKNNVETTRRVVSTKQKIALIGKGLTFDSGGISLKPSESMENMKIDMAGAAAVLGVFSVLSKLGENGLSKYCTRITNKGRKWIVKNFQANSGAISTIKQDQGFLEIHGIIPVCENMPSGRALKPGDVIKIFSGQTVEIFNTDAEGRLIIADALAYAVKQKADIIIDLATLTGACITALGELIAGLFCNNKSLANQIIKAAKYSGEDIWRLPLYENYQNRLKSQIADLRNTSKIRSGGAIFGALFLQKFVGKTRWAHLDIAGPAWAEEKINSYTKVGGTGFGVRLLLEFLNNL